MDSSSGWRVSGVSRRFELRLHPGEAKQDGTVGGFLKKRRVFLQLHENKKN